MFLVPSAWNVMYDAPADANYSIWTSTISLPQVSWTSMGASTPYARRAFTIIGPQLNFSVK